MEAQTGTTLLHSAGCGATAIRLAAFDVLCSMPNAGAHYMAEAFVLDEAEVTFWGLCSHCQDTEENDD